MTHYPGGKKRIGLELAEEIHYWSTEYEEQSGQKLKGYCEPFCGMLGVYQHVPVLFEDDHPRMKYLAGDRDPTIICMWKAAQKGWKPPRSCSEARFYRLKKSKVVTPEKAFLGRAASFRGTYFNTYTTDNNIPLQAENVEDISKELYDVKFTEGKYIQFSHLKDCVIYCDPPYRKTRNFYIGDGFKVEGNFNTDKFDQWCQKMSKNNVVFISEFSMPRKFKKNWSKGKEKLYEV